MRLFNRRQALGLLSAMPLATRVRERVRAQTRAGATQRVSLGDMHGLLLDADGTLHAWQRSTATDAPAMDALGLGHNHQVPSHTLARVAGLTGVVSAVAGRGCSFAILADGTLLAWGLNSGDGLLGTTPLSMVETLAASGPNSNRPAAVPLDDVVQVSTSNTHVLALARDGRVHGWGRGERGQLGIGAMPVIRFRTRTSAAMPYVPFPVRVPDLMDVAAVSAGYTHSLALMKDGTVRAWGENRWGQLGDGTTVNRNVPIVVPGVKGAVAVAAGSVGFSVALLADGTVMAWGNRFGGATGRTVATDNLADPNPGLVPGVRGVKAVVAGQAHVLALTEGGTILSWGMSDFGALGRGLKAQSAAAPLRSVTGAQSVAASGDTSLAVLANGRIMTWGTVRPWTRPPEEGPMDTFSHVPILLWLDGLEQP